MIGVPLQGGKTLKVTFRSLNTRFDFFKSAEQPNHTNVNSIRPNSIDQFPSQSAASSANEKSFGQSQFVVSTSPRQEQFLKKAVQQGVMRGLASSKRRNSRVTPGRAPDANSAYSQSRKGSRVASPFRSPVPSRSIASND